MERGLYSQKLTIVVIFVAAILTDSLTYGQVNVEPNTALLNEGDRTELLCRYGRSINYCRIEIPGEKVLNLSPDWSKTPGFTYYGAGLAAGQCGVSIERVKANNNGQVKCSLGVEGEELSGTIDLVVALRPQQPLIELISKSDREGYFTEGSNFQARCIVRDGRPAANITWLIDEQPADKRTSQLEVVASPTDNNVMLSTTVQEIQWHLGAEDNGRKLICRSHHQTDRENVPPQEGAYQLLVRFVPVRQPEALVYGLYLDHTVMVNMTIRANPAPVVEWTVDGVVIPQGTQNGRFSVYEPQYLGQDYYNVTMAIAGLTLEDTTKTYQMRASNAIGSTDYQVRISSSSTPPTAGLDIGAIVGIVVAVAVLIVIVLLIVFARATGRWCFGGATLNTDLGPDSEAQINPHLNEDFDGREFNTGKSAKTPTNETSDTESADVKATSTATIATTTAASEDVRDDDDDDDDDDVANATAHVPSTNETTTKKSKRLPSFAAIFKRLNEKDGSAKRKDKAAAAATDNAEGAAVAEGTDGNDNEPKEDKQLVYAELVLKPAADNIEQPLPTPTPMPMPTPAPKNSTEYAEIVYVQKPNPEHGQK